ncbi:MAG: hypothetical protein SH847_10215 [Roseiflexaceae bacterium]|nr:hypothetical protein [Roseiflexaceae bacterium]
MRVAERVGNRVLIQRYRGDLADAMYFLGDLYDARQLFEDILTQTSPEDDLVASWETQLRIARIEIEEGRYDAAQQLMLPANEAVQQMNISYGTTLVLRQQGYLAMLRNNAPAARQLLETCCQRAISSFFIEELAASLIGLAKIALPGDPTQAARHCGAYEGLIERVSSAD